MTKKKFATIMVMAVLAFALAACGSSGNGNGGDADKNAAGENNSGDKSGESSGKQLIVATDNSFVPFEFLNKDTGEIQGFDIDLIRAVAKEANLNIKIKPMDFKGVLAGLKSGRWDMGIAGITITEERDQSIDFSDPYYDAGIILAVQANNSEIKSVDDLAGKTVATRTGTTSQYYLEDNVPKAKIKTYPKITQAYQSLATGRVDAVLYDLPNVKYYIKTKGDGKLKTVGDRLTAEQYGIAFQEDSKLVDKVNEALAAIKENGTYKEIYEKWFGKMPESK
ncbi:MAG TPA: glutamine ABC transporter substrate-binding protein [Bacillales bacterium]|nr:glutamine ABC transporter substrate-binding protein [Bacillales bacterium]